METDWDTVLQFVADPLDYAMSEKQGGSSERSPMAVQQMPTPPVSVGPPLDEICLLTAPQQSLDGSPVVEENPEENTLVSVSTTFYPGAEHTPFPADIVFLSSDGVFFYAHHQIVSNASDNAFQGLLSTITPGTKEQETVITVPDNSTAFNVVLHTVYDISCAHYSPSFETLCEAVNRMAFYGISPKKYIVPSSPLYVLLLSHAPLYPLELYALAASHDIYDLAVSTSSHLLSFPLASLTDEMADRIGPVYLKRLFFLHFGRSDALKRVLLPPPHPHAPTPSCDFTEQKKLTRAWALASAYLAWDARPGAFVPFLAPDAHYR